VHAHALVESMAFSDWCCDLPKHFVSVCRSRASTFLRSMHQSAAMRVFPAMLIRGAESPGQKAKT
jgi:hypothetical protein